MAGAGNNPEIRREPKTRVGCSTSYTPRRPPPCTSDDMCPLSSQAVLGPGQEAPHLPLLLAQQGAIKKVPGTALLSSSRKLAASWPGDRMEPSAESNRQGQGHGLNDRDLRGHRKSTGCRGGRSPLPLFAAMVWACPCPWSLSQAQRLRLCPSPGAHGH